MTQRHKAAEELHIGASALCGITHHP